MRSIRALLAVLLSLALTQLASSCVSVLGLEGFSGAVEQLCEQLEKCYGAKFYPNCVEVAGARLDGADAGERAQFLKAFADGNCLENCTNALACLDEVPICGGKGVSCGEVEHCCGFGSGKGSCEEGACCAPLGTACSSTSDCCEQACVGGLCGGVECTDLDEACAQQGECCGDLVCGAISGVCQQCFPVGNECSVGEDCCELNCVFYDGGPTGFCEEPFCELKQLGDDCIEASECCDGFCVFSELLQARVCSDCDGLFEGHPCNGDGECCRGVCDPVFGCGNTTCTALLGEGCAAGDCCDGLCEESRCCIPDFEPCSFGPENCCSKKCRPDAMNGTVCGGDSGPCLPPLGCDFCVTGIGPLSQFACDLCIQDTCLQYPDCCCTNWDETCKAAAIACYGDVACPN